MSDQELDRILETWTLAPPSPSLRDRLRAQYRFRPPRRFPLRSLSFAVAVSVISVLAFSQTSKLFTGFAGTPFTVDLERSSYADDRSVTRTLRTCYELPGTRMKYSDNRVDGPCWAASRNLLDAAKFITLRIAPALILRQETEREKKSRQHFRKAGCVAPNGVVLGHENIAGYGTVKVVFGAPGSERQTDWYAPDLNCFVMRKTVEEVDSDGKLHMRSRDVVLAVHKQ